MSDSDNRMNHDGKNNWPRVLVIEERVKIAWALKRFLESESCEVILAHNRADGFYLLTP